MNESLIPFFIAWSVVAVVVAGLAVYRWVLGLHEDDSIHISDTSHDKEQGTLARTMTGVERWGKALTLLMVVGGLVLASIVLYSAWVTPRVPQ